MIRDKTQRIKVSDCMVVCDFDGTITKQDAYYVLLEQHGLNYNGLLEQFNRGLIDSRKFMERTFFLFDVIWSDLEECFDHVALDPNFQRLSKLCQMKNWDIWIVSDGLDWWINKILANYHLDNIPVCSNQVVFTSLGPRFLYPWFDETCPICRGRFAVCKGHVIRQLRKYTKKIVFVGDGKSDQCALPEADDIFAKGALAQICKQSAKKYYPFQDFGDVHQVLEEMKLN